MLDGSTVLNAPKCHLVSKTGSHRGQREKREYGQPTHLIPVSNRAKVEGVTIFYFEQGTHLGIFQDPRASARFKVYEP